MQVFLNIPRGAQQQSRRQITSAKRRSAGARWKTCVVFASSVALTVSVSLWIFYMNSVLWQSHSEFQVEQSILTIDKGVRNRGRRKEGNADSLTAKSDKGKHADAVSRDPTFPLPRVPTHHACDDVKGIYHIQLTDELGGVGTAFFQLVIGQILYAERNRLKPWIHLNNFSRVFWDDSVHGVGPGAQFTMRQGGPVPYVHRPGGHRRDQTPGPPDFSVSNEAREYTFSGTGVWEHYFEPLSDFVPGDESCVDKVYVTMDLYLITPGLHGYDQDMATRCWRYDYLPAYITQPHLSYHEWLEPQRVRAHNVIQRYFHFRPYLTDAAARVNPNCGQTTLCLGLHIRHSDKAAGRQVIPLNDFVPYVDAFFKAGGDYVYLATDSALVLNDVQRSWPSAWTSRLRTLGSDIIRSVNRTAVFDMASHHRTNQEVLVEILALSHCQFLVHGLSAVSETSIWINLSQHNRSVNLEDGGEHISAEQFRQVVTLTKQGAPDQSLPQPRRTHRWWDRLSHESALSTNGSRDSSRCEAHNGILLITEVETQKSSMIAEVVFSSILKQLIVAEKLNLKPAVALDKQQIEILYDENAHRTTDVNWSVAKANIDQAGCPVLPQSPVFHNLTLRSSDVWETYFPNSFASRSACKNHVMPVFWLDAQNIQTMTNTCPWISRGLSPGKRDPESEESQTWRQDRRKNFVSKYLSFHPVLHEKAFESNPIGTDEVCMGVLFQMTRANEGSNRRITAEDYLPYLKAFVKKSDGPIYIASDSSRPLRYMEKNFPAEVTRRFRSQGRWVARSPTTDIPVHMMDSHHRINSEVLVDILALAKCRVLLHTSNAMDGAVLYLSTDGTYDINLEDQNRPLPNDLESFLSRSSEGSQAGSVLQEDIEFKIQDVSGARILSRNTAEGFLRSKNAIVYLAQKKHSTYGRDSYETLLKSLRLLRQNYFERHADTADIFIFHVASFTKDDLKKIEQMLGPTSRGAVRLVDLVESAFWGRPDFLQDSDPSKWYAYPLFAEGYRHMIQFFAIHIWEFFARLNQSVGSSYRYILRLDEDSFLHSPVDYDIFDFMGSNGYVYGYRMCSYEMETAQRIWKRYQQARGRAHVPKRPLELKGCGFYNNFHIADLNFFRSSDVQDWLRFVYERGHIYVWLLGDLMIHTMTIYKFAEASQVHRFLDFTYEHGTVNSTSGCLVWGGMQAGYRDDKAAERLEEYFQDHLQNGACLLNKTSLSLEDLSPSYAHLPVNVKTVSLTTVVAGKVEIAGKGLLSG